MTITHAVKQPQKSTGRIALALGVCAVCVIGGIAGNIAQMNSSTKKGFMMRETEQRISALRAQNEKLTVEMATMRSMGHMQGMMSMLGMVPAGRYVFIPGLTKGEVASR